LRPCNKPFSFYFDFQNVFASFLPVFPPA